MLSRGVPVAFRSCAALTSAFFGALSPACPFAFAICAVFCAIALLFAALLLVPVVLSGLLALPLL
jgi:uncharacterized membrane protein